MITSSLPPVASGRQYVASTISASVKGALVFERVERQISHNTHLTSLSNKFQGHHLISNQLTYFQISDDQEDSDG